MEFILNFSQNCFKKSSDEPEPACFLLGDLEYQIHRIFYRDTNCPLFQRLWK